MKLIKNMLKSIAKVHCYNIVNIIDLLRHMLENQI